METKVVIALPDEVFAAAEVLARRLGLSRGALYAAAVAEFVACHRRMAGGGLRDPPFGPRVDAHGPAGSGCSAGRGQVR